MYYFHGHHHVFTSVHNPDSTFSGSQQRCVSCQNVRQGFCESATPQKTLTLKHLVTEIQAGWTNPPTCISKPHYAIRW